MVHRAARLFFLAVTFIFAVISAAVGLNALVKSNQEKQYVKSSAPGALIEINTNDILYDGIVLIAINAILAITCLVAMFIPSHFRMANRVTGAMVLFWSLWIFACMVAYDVFYATGSAKVSAFLGGVPLPPGAVTEQEYAIGVNPAYRKQPYLRWVAVIPWFTVVFGLISSVLLFLTHDDSAPSSYFTKSSQHQQGVQRA